MFLHEKDCAYKSFIRNGRPVDRHDEIQHMISEGSKLVDNAKQKYFSKIVMTLADPSTGSKRYWWLINKVPNYTKFHEIPPLLEKGSSTSDFSSKVQSCNDYFLLQCMLLYPET